MKKDIAIIILIFTVLVIILVKIILNTNIDFTSFNRELWNKYPDKRYEMILDFEKTFSIEELNKENVLALLGEVNMSKTENMYSYTIGDNLFSTKYYALIFNMQGQCIKRYIYED